MKKLTRKTKWVFIFLSLGILSCGSDNNSSNESFSMIGSDSVLKITSNEKIKEMYQIKDGEKTGFYKLYNDEGGVIEEGSVIKGNKEGLIKLYQNSVLTSVAYYEKNLKVYELDKHDFIYDSLNLKYFKICFPKNWKTNINPQENVLLIGRKNCDSSDVFCPVFSITKEKTNLSLKEYSSNALSLMQSKIEKMKILNENNFTINGFNIIQVRYMILKDGQTLGLQTGFCKINDEIFVMTGTAINDKDGEFLKYDGLFEEIILSIYK
ncbi:MAG: hypothetical protein IM600_10135 [Bacteroidetes bacterium]|nr:hypothetical protein [Bacteroidota bacterium]MCA6443774.1 hypothetical protein [Bacteroidota bacterium]